MAWGIFKKIGQGLKKGFNWVKDHIVKPVAKFVSPVAKVAAPVVGAIVPGAEKLINAGTSVVDKLAGNNALPASNALAGMPPPTNNMVGMNGHGIRTQSVAASRKQIDDWTQPYDNYRIRNQKIQLK